MSCHFYSPLPHTVPETARSWSGGVNSQILNSLAQTGGGAADFIGNILTCLWANWRTGLHFSGRNAMGTSHESFRGKRPGDTWSKRLWLETHSRPYKALRRSWGGTFWEIKVLKISNVCRRMERTTHRPRKETCSERSWEHLKFFLRLILKHRSGCEWFIWDGIPRKQSEGVEKGDREERKSIKGVFMNGLLL